MKVELILCGSFGENCYIAGNDKEVFVVDPGDDAKVIIAAIAEREVKYILNTHCHIDHIGAVNELRKKYAKAKFCIHEAEKSMLKNPSENLSSFMGQAITLDDADMLLKDGDELDFAGDKIKVIHTPGHTKGGVSFLYKDALFSGDTLFNMSIGRTDFPGGSYEQIINSILTKLMVLPDETKVYPGHMEVTTIGFEKKRNPFLK
jgi:glyoxylase-like metal-dependent hydrolase (beta-lactamase superfamily II)